MASVHITNGDCLATQLLATQIGGEIITCRECLIDGDVKANTLERFWQIRAQFIEQTYHAPTGAYDQKTVAEFKKLESLSPKSDVYLWFENDLFCQVNMWFVVSLLSELQPTATLYRIFPVIEHGTDTWKGFGVSTPEMLEKALLNKVAFTPEDIQLTKELWAAYQNSDFAALEALANQPSNSYHFLPEVCKAHKGRFSSEGDSAAPTPEQIMKEIMQSGITDFASVFTAFSSKAGIYGFGDMQLKTIYDKISGEH